MTLGEALLCPTKIYVKEVLEILANHTVNGMVHVTGGGFTENIPRVLPEGLGANINLDSWEMNKLFPLIQTLGDIETSEMYKTFNMGIGFVLIADPEHADAIINTIENMGEKAFKIGTVKESEGIEYI